MRSFYEGLISQSILSPFLFQTFLVSSMTFYGAFAIKAEQVLKFPISDGRCISFSTDPDKKLCNVREEFSHHRKHTLQNVAILTDFDSLWLCRTKETIMALTQEPIQQSGGGRGCSFIREGDFRGTGVVDRGSEWKQREATFLAQPPAKA